MTKKLLIGADEAGYGPNLGPLVVATTLWEVPASMDENQLCAALAQDFACSSWKPACQTIPLGDSKKLYKPRGGLASLEAGLFSLWAQTRPVPTQFQSLFQAVEFESPQLRQLAKGAGPLAPWYGLADTQPVPVDLPRPEIARLAALAGACLSEGNIRLLDMRATILAEDHFNRGVEALNSKGLLLSQTTLQLVAELLEQHPGAAEVYCDRQGGRKDYMPLLMQVFPDYWFQERPGSPQRCSYRARAPRELDVHFSVGGDRFPPTALASMLAKYLREQVMQAFNAYWRRQVPGLKPTAGYPVDAKRFRQQIAATAECLGLAPERWWRQR